MKRIILLAVFCSSVFQMYSQNIAIEDTIKFVERIAARDSLIHGSRSKEKEQLLNETIADQDSIIGILNTAYEELLVKSQNEAKVKDFFCCSDSTVFGTKFMEIDIENYPSYLKEYYRLICDFRVLEQELIQIEQKVEEIKGYDIAEEYKRDAIRDKIKQPLENLENHMREIEENTNVVLLSEGQKDFYRKNIFPRYKALSDLISNNINSETE